MKKKPAVKTKSMTSEDHRKIATKHDLKRRFHEVKADMLDVDEPPKPTKLSKGKVTTRPY